MIHIVSPFFVLRYFLHKVYMTYVALSKHTLIRGSPSFRVKLIEIRKLSSEQRIVGILIS